MISKTESYVTCAFNDNEALLALTLSRSIRRTWTTRRVSIVVSDNVSGFLRIMLENEFDYIFGITSEFVKEYGKPYLQYSCWKLKLWTKCVYISPNTLAMENCDHLFELPTFSKVELDGNDVLVVYEPDMDVYGEFLRNHKQVLASGPASLDEIEDFANVDNSVFAFCSRKWKQLSFKSAGIQNPDGHFKLLHFNTLPWATTTFDLSNQTKWEHILFQDVVPSLNGLPERFKSSMDTLLHKLGIVPKSPTVIGRNVEPLTHTYPTQVLEGTIAIIGMSCRFPGANNPQEFWELLAQGGDAVTSFPFERLSPREKCTAIPASYDGGFLKCPIDEFDAQFFGMSPREAQFVDPQQRLLLEVTWEALENAGINPQTLKGTKTSAYVGIHMQDYEKLIRPVGAQEYHHSYLGNCLSATASRVSYFLGLVGPNVAVESGCSSASVAVHLACESLKYGESSLSLASGVNLLLKRNEKSGATLMAVLSPDSRCKTFDSSANGFARAEGCGTLVLKRLGDALRNGDNVLALIRGSAINNDGPGQSFGTPSTSSQENVIREALQAAGMNPAEISYVEAHGTGTPIGDPLEFQGLTNAYSTPERKEPLLIGSVKTNIGHTESAAGIAGIIKVVLCMKNKAIAPHLHLKNINPTIDLSSIPATIPTVLTEWNACSTRSAGVSSFSMSGTSTHVILQEALQNDDGKGPTKCKRNPQIVTLSAKTQTGLENLIKKYIEYLSENDKLDIEDVAFTLNQCKANFPYRTALLTANVPELTNLLQNGEYSIQHVAPSTCGQNKIGFLFTGQGSQHVGMGKVLYESCLPFRRALDQVATLYESHLHVKLQDVLWHDDAYYLNKTVFCQPAIFCIEYALAQHWLTLGLKPDYVLGHSIGEFGALVCAGLVTLEDAMRLVVERSRLVNSLPSGRMLVLKTSFQIIKTLIEKFQLGRHKELLAPIDVAAVNSSNEIVVSSTVDSINSFEEFCATEKVRVIKLAASHAFHSRQMDPVLDEFEKIAKTVKYIAQEQQQEQQQVNDITYISGTRAKVMGASDFEAEMYWSDHLRDTVQFAKAVNLMNKLGCNMFLEIGPQPVLLGLAMANIEYSSNNVFCPSLKKGEQDWALFLGTLGKLYLGGICLDLAALYGEGERPKKLQLPTYAFERQKFWFVDTDDVPDQDVYKLSAIPVHPILGREMRTPFAEQLYSSKLSTRRLPYLLHHKICQHVILPGAAFLEASLAVGSEILNGNGQLPLVIQDLVIAAALPVGATVLLETVVQVRGDAGRNAGIQYEISFQRPILGDTWKHHAAAVFTPGAVLPVKHSIDIEAIKAKLQLRNAASISALYRQLSQRGINFGSQFQSIQCAWTNSNEILSQIEMPKSAPNEGYICHPIVLDAMIQTFAFGFALNDTAAGNENGGGQDSKSLRLPVAIRKFIWLAKPVTKLLYAHAALERGSTDVGDISLYDQLGNCVAVMEQLELVKVRADAFERNLIADRAPLPGFYHNSWKPIVAKSSQPKKAEVVVEQHQKETEIDNVVILFNTSAESTPLVRELASELTAKERRVIVVNHSHTNSNGPKGFEFEDLDFDFRNKLNFDNFFLLLQNVILRNGAELEGMYYFCTGDTQASAIQEIYNVNCGGLLNLCQTIINKEGRQQRESRCKLMVVTKGVWTTDAEPAGHPNNAPLWGITKNFISECQIVDAKIVDIGLEEQQQEQQRSDKLVQQLLQNFWAPADEKFLVIKNGKTLSERVWCMPNATKVLAIPNVDRYTVVVPPTGTISDLQVRPCNRKNPTGSFIEVAVRAVGLNFRDLMVILQPEEFHKSSVVVGLDEDCVGIGMDISGVVVAVGPDVKRRAVGDEIIGITSHGLQSHVLIHENCTMAKPTTMTAAGASTIPCVFMTSYYSLVEICKISAKDRVLIHVGAGGVGLSAIQIAQSAGAEIYTTAGTKRKREYLRSVLGLKYIYNSRDTEYGGQIRRDTKGQGVTIVLNSLTGPNFKETTLECCAEGASFVEIGKLNTWTVEQVTTLRPDVHYTIVDLYPMIVNGEHDPTITNYMHTFANLMEEQTISALPRTTFALERIREAFGYFQKAKHIGKIVVKMPKPKLNVEIGRFSLCHEYFDAESTYLISGGYGAIGMEVTKWMATSGARHIVLVGRNEPTPQNVKVLDELRAQGCNVQAWQADVGDYDKCNDILQRIKSSPEFPPLRGLFLATGVISDSLIANQSWEKFELTFHSKVYPAWHFHQLTLDYDLDFFTMFSSFVSSIGSAGQSNHSAACSYLDSLTHYRQAHGLVSSTINWGAWSDIGQASNQRMGQEGMFGYRSFTPAQGIRAMEHFMSQNLTEGSIAQVENWKLLQANLNSGKLLDEVMTTEEVADSGTSQEALWKLVEDSANDYERQLNLEEYLKDAIRSILKLRVTDVIDKNQELSELGVDSLTSMELRNHLQKMLGTKVVTPDAMQENRTIQKLAAQLATLFNSTGTSPGQAPISLTELVTSDCVLPANIRVSPDAQRPVPKSELKVVFLTGATGFVGVHVAYEILTKTNWAIICLVRAESSEAAMCRFMKTLNKFEQPVQGLPFERITFVCGDIVQENIGLIPEEYDSIASRADAVVHCAGKVHLLEFYTCNERASSLRAVNYTGFTNVLRFTVAKKVKWLYHPSYVTVATSITEDGYFMERFPTIQDYSDGLTNGYIISKFVQEVLVSQMRDLGVPCTVLRLPGVWGNEMSSKAYKDVFTHIGRFLKACISFRKFPIFDSNTNNPDVGIPVMIVNAAAEIVVKLVQRPDIELGVYNSVSNCKSNVITQTCLEELMKEHGLECQFMDGKTWRDTIFNDNNEKKNFLLPFKYLYEDGKQSLRVLELHPLLHEDRGVIRFDEKFVTKLRRNLPDLSLAELSAKDILKHHYADELKQ